MLTLRMYSVYDSKAAAYLNPWTAPSDAVAYRAFATAAVDPEHDFCRWPADFTLFHVGYWNTTTGHIITIEAKENLGTALDLIQRLNSEQHAPTDPPATTNTEMSPLQATIRKVETS